MAFSAGFDRTLDFFLVAPAFSASGGKRCQKPLDKQLRGGVLLLESHSRSCVVDAIKHGDEEQAITELMGVYKALHK